MATFYWVGGAGTWTNVSTANWSTTSGGSGGAGPVTYADDVIFNSASSAAAYTLTIGASATCQNCTIAGPATGNVTVAGTSAWTIGGSFSANNVTRTFAGPITFTANVPNNTIKTSTYFASATSGSIVFNASQPSYGWKLLSAWANASVGGSLSLLNGYIDLNDWPLLSYNFNSTGTNPRQLMFANTSFIQITGSTATGANINFNNLIVTGVNPTLFDSSTATSRNIVFWDSTKNNTISYICSSAGGSLIFKANTGGNPYFKNFTFSGTSGAGITPPGIGSSDIYVTGNLYSRGNTGVGSTTPGGFDFVMVGNPNNTPQYVDSNANVSSNTTNTKIRSLNINGGNVILTSDLIANTEVKISEGNLDTNGFSILSGRFSSDNSLGNTRSLILRSNSSMYLNYFNAGGGENYVWTTNNSTGLSTTYESNNIVQIGFASGVPTSNISVQTGNATLPNIVYTVSNTSYGLIFNTSGNYFPVNPTINDLTATSLPTVIYFGPSTYNFNNFSLKGTSSTSNVAIRIYNSTGSQAIYFTKRNLLTVNSDYLVLANTNAIGSNWYAGANSVNLISNSGWIFTAAPLITIRYGSRLLANGVLYTPTGAIFDEVTKGYSSITINATYASNFDEVTIRNGTVAKRETSNGNILVSGSLDEITGIQ